MCIRMDAKYVQRCIYPSMFYGKKNAYGNKNAVKNNKIYHQVVIIQNLKTNLAMERKK